MADATQVAKLNEGAAAWNAWRAGCTVAIDLTGASFVGKDLTGADLRFANFERANLRSTKLGRDTLAWNANFSYADLYKAEFEGGMDSQRLHRFSDLNGRC